MEVTYRRNLYKSYMCIKAQEDVQEEYELHMLEKQKISGLLPMQTTVADGLQAYFYEISGKQQMEDYLSGRKIDYGILKRLLFSIQELCKVLPDYMLREDGLCLEFQFIYVNLEDKSLHFTYLPFWKKDLPEAFQEFMEQVLRKINHQDQAATDLAYQIYQMCARENANIGQMLAASLGKQEADGDFQAENGQDEEGGNGAKKRKHEDLCSGSIGAASERKGKKGADRDPLGNGRQEGEETGKWDMFVGYVKKKGIGLLPLSLKGTFFSAHVQKGNKARQETIPKGETHMEREGIKNRRSFIDFFKWGEPVKRPKRRLAKELSEDGLQEVDLEQVPERGTAGGILDEGFLGIRPDRKSMKEYMQKTEAPKAEVKPVKRIPKESPKERVHDKKAEVRSVRGIPKEYLQDKGTSGTEVKPVRGIPKEYLQDMEVPGTEVKLVKRIPKKSLQNKEMPRAEVGAVRGIPKESPREYATEILEDFGCQPEGILVYQGAHGCGDIIIEGEEFLVGKNKGQVDGFIDARGISRLHARIIREEDVYYIEDLNSTNGTYLNGMALEYHQKMELRKDDRIRFGSEEYVFC